MKLSSENQRMWDLVQVERFLLHDLGLITDDELDLLAGDGAAVKRLEDYDALQAKLHELEGIDKVADFAHENIVKMQAELDAAKAQVAAAFLVAADKLDASPVSAAASEIVRSLMPADAERSLQVYAQERVLEALQVVRGSQTYREHCGAALDAAIVAAATRLAELRNTKA